MIHLIEQLGYDFINDENLDEALKQKWKKKIMFHEDIILHHNTQIAMIAASLSRLSSQKAELAAQRAEAAAEFVEQLRPR